MKFQSACKSFSVSKRNSTDKHTINTQNVMCLNTNLDMWLNAMNFHSKLHAGFSEMLYINIFCRFQLTLVAHDIPVTFDVCNLICVDMATS